VHPVAQPVSVQGSAQRQLGAGGRGGTGWRTRRRARLAWRRRVVRVARGPRPRLRLPDLPAGPHRMYSIMV